MAVRLACVFSPHCTGTAVSACPCGPACEILLYYSCIKNYIKNSFLFSFKRVDDGLINTDRCRYDGRWFCTGWCWCAVFNHYDTQYTAAVNTLKHALVGLKLTRKRAWHFSKSTRAIFINCCAFVARDRGSVLLHCRRRDNSGTSGFVDNVIFAHNRHRGMSIDTVSELSPITCMNERRNFVQ